MAATMTPETPETPPMQDPEDPPDPAVPPCEVVPVSAELRADYDLDPFYTKVALARGVMDDPRWAWHAARKLGAEATYSPMYARCKPGAWRPAHED